MFTQIITISHVLAEQGCDPFQGPANAQTWDRPCCIGAKKERNEIGQTKEKYKEVGRWCDAHHSNAVATQGCDPPQGPTDAQE